MKLPREHWSGMVIATLGSVLAVVGVVFLFQSPPVHAANRAACAGAGPEMDYGVYEWCGYFDNHFDSSGQRLWNDGVPASVGTAGTALGKVNQLINFIIGERSDELGDGEQGVTSAEFIIDTMMNLGPNSNPKGTRAEAWDQQAKWEQELRLGVEDNVISIDWFENVNWHCGQMDTYYQGAEGGGAPNDVSFYDTIPGGEDPNCGPDVTVPAIVFRDVATNKIIYEIKRICGNPFGTVDSLPTVNFDVVPSGFLTDTQVPVGGTDTLHVHLVNNGPATSEVGSLQVGATNAGGATAFYGSVANPCADANPATGPPCVPLNQSALNPARSTGQGFQTASYYAGLAGADYAPDWWWTTTNLADGDEADGTVQFTVPATAPIGNVTFHVCYHPATEGGVSACAAVVLTIVSERTALVIATNGDVHAGGGLCGGTETNGYVEGSGSVEPGNSSLDQYVVSASAANGIVNFGSNGAVSGSVGDTLGLGQNGEYEQVCRENLLAAANAYRADGGSGYTVHAPTAAQGGSAANPYNITGWSGLNYITGTAYITGQVNNKMTIVVTTGNLNISGNITITTASFPPNQVPSLGIIAANDILIHDNVTLVNAYLFANGTIDTCEEGESSNSACTNNLTVDGFLMGNNLELRRIGPTNTNGAQVTETIVLTPQLYLNPPQFFDAAVDDISLQGQGEEQPLF